MSIYGKPRFEPRVPGLHAAGLDTLQGSRERRAALRKADNPFEWDWQKFQNPRFKPDFSRFEPKFGPAPSKAGSGAKRPAARTLPVPPIQTALEVSEPGDALEQEAERVAERVMRMPGAGGPPRTNENSDGLIARDIEGEEEPSTAMGVVQRACAECEEDDDQSMKVQRNAVGGGAAKPRFGAALSSARAGGGEPLPAAVRGFMEPRFGQDFSDVRLHRDARANELTGQVEAKAFTVGSDLFFREGEFAPGTDKGQRLIAHELTHVVQQREGMRSVQREIVQRQEVAEEPAATATASHAVGSRWVVRTPGGGNVRLRIRAREDAQQSAGNLKSGRGVTVIAASDPKTDRDARENGFVPVRGDVDGGRTAAGFVQVRHLVAEVQAEPPAPAVHDDTRNAAEEKAKQQSEVQATLPMDIPEQWASMRAAFIEVASGRNALSGRQMYQIWLRLWMERQSKAVTEFQAIDQKLRSEDTAAYAAKRFLFDKGRRDVLGPEYEAAADQRDTADFILSELREIVDWLDTKVDVMGRHVTLQQINEKSLEIAQAKAMFRLYMAPLILGAMALSAGATVRQPRPPGAAPKTPEARPTTGEASKPSTPRPQGLGPTPAERATDTASEVGTQMAAEMKAAGFKGNPFREFANRLNARIPRLSQAEAAEAIVKATPEFSKNLGTAPPVFHGDVLVVPSRAPIPNAPIVGIRPDGTVIMGRVEKLEVVLSTAGRRLVPQSRLIGKVTFE